MRKSVLVLLIAIGVAVALMAAFAVFARISVGALLAGGPSV